MYNPFQTASRGARRGATIQCLALRRQVETVAERERKDDYKIATLQTGMPIYTALAQTLACPSETAAFARTSASSLTLSKPEEGRQAEGLEEAL